MQKKCMELCGAVTDPQNHNISDIDESLGIPRTEQFPLDQLPNEYIIQILYKGKITGRTKDDRSIVIDEIKSLKGLSVYSIFMGFGGEDENKDQRRGFFADLQLKCNISCIAYGRCYFPIPDVYKWKKVTIVREYYKDEESAENHVDFLEELKKEDRSEHFEVKIYSVGTAEFNEVPASLKESFRQYRRHDFPMTKNCG